MRIIIYLGFVEYAAGRYDEAAEALQHVATHHLGSQRILAASLAQLGRVAETKAEGARFLATHPDFSIRYGEAHSRSSAKPTGSISSMVI